MLTHHAYCATSLAFIAAAICSRSNADIAASDLFEHWQVSARPRTAQGCTIASFIAKRRPQFRGS
jgi:hypothetical protein